MVQIEALSGEIVAEFDDDELDEMIGSNKLVKDLKKVLADRIGVSRFRQRLFTGEIELQDNMPLPSVPSVQLVTLNFAEPDQGMEEKLLQQCKENNLGEVEMLLRKPQDPDRKPNANMIAPIHAAADEGHLEVMKLLLEARADTNSKTAFGATALHPAARKGLLEVVQVLLEAGANTNVADSNGIAALHWAAAAGHLEVLQVLLQAGADINAAALSGRTALHAAAVTGHSEVVRVLLQADADMDVAASDGATALYLAALNGNLNVLETLLQAGADMNVADSNGETALHKAKAKCHWEAVRLLHEACAGKEASAE